MAISKAEQKLKHEVGSKEYNKAVEHLERQQEKGYVEGNDTRTGEKMQYKKDVADVLQLQKKFEKSKLTFTGLGGLLDKK